MATQTVPTHHNPEHPTNPELYDAPPVHGNFTGDPDQHIACAEAMAIVITGEGFESFKSWNETIKQDYLWALSLEIRRARQSLAAEREERRRAREA